MVLAPLVKRLPPHLRAIVRADAVATSDPTARASLLQALEAELAVDEAQEVRETARAAAREIEFLPSRAAALARLADGSRAQGRQALDAVSQIEDEHGCSISLAEITPFLASALADEIATMARAFAGARERARVLAALAAHVSDPARTELAHEAMAEVRDSDWQLDEVTSTLEPSLGSKTVNALLLELDRVSSDTLRARVAAQLPTQNLHDAWRASLTRFAAEDRQALLHRMEALIPQASALGGERVLIDIAQCLSQARRWWP
jgi:hypothetical protein